MNNELTTEFDYDAYLDAKAQEVEEANNYNNFCAFGQPVDAR